ncbi:hypothetical protein QVD17_30379 [Tagetes erecta]|uniref:Uncharacterized protein n=1 Tax=Tagetes erecta TaxID=13708 RepID=A0AAD8NFY5_TARER|nr:hypothetical protein QVD17_30379 [Tagetes erecta]
MILQFGTFNFGSGRAYVNFGFQGTSLYMNEDIKDINASPPGFLLLEKKQTEASSSLRIVTGNDLDEPKDVIVCPTSRCKVFSTVPRFKFDIRVQDSTGVVSLTLMDRQARRFLRRTAKELIDKMLDIFKIDISEFNINNKYKSFTIIKWIEDPTAISTVESTYAIQIHIAFTGVKHKLADSFDVEESPSTSRCKPSKDITEDAIKVPKSAMLVPKLEK